MDKTAKGSQEKILDLFRDGSGDYLSGEQISRALGVSRTAVWKHISHLRDLGYGIEAATSRGYRLVTTPDALIPAEIRADLGTLRIGGEIVFLAETDSTNLRAHGLGEGGAAEGAVVIADSQSAGKGRMGRQWISPPGVNLYVSILLRPPILPWHAPQLTFLSALATARALEEVGEIPASVKWPNDVLLGGKKVAGLLNEMSAETEGIHYVILGIGVNLNMKAEQFPADLRYPATSVALQKGAPVSRLAFTRALLRHLDALYDLYLERGFSPIIQAWEALFELAGSEVEVDFQSHQVRGVVQGLDEDGALLLRHADGSIERVLAGDVRPV